MRPLNQNYGEKDMEKLLKFSIIGGIVTIVTSATFVIGATAALYVRNIGKKWNAPLPRKYGDIPELIKNSLKNLESMDDGNCAAEKDEEEKKEPLRIPRRRLRVKTIKAEEAKPEGGEEAAL
jgi:hypothetical protein